MIGNLHQEGYPLAVLCQTLQLSRSGYYAFRRGYLSNRKQADQVLRPQIRAVFWDHERRYGARRISQELSSRGVCCGVKRVGRLMREMG